MENILLKKKLVTILPYCMLLSGFSFSFLGFRIRLDHLFSILFSLITVFLILFSKKKKVIITKAGFILIIFSLNGFLVSIYNSENSKYTFIQSIGYFSCVFTYFLIINLITRYEHIKYFLKSYINACIITSSIAIFLFIFSNIAHYELYGINLVQNEFEPFGIYFLMVEPNIYGAYMLTGFLLLFPLFISRKYIDIELSRLKLYFFLSLTGLSIILSFTRGVWLACIICLFFYYLTDNKISFKLLINILIIIIFIIIIFYFLGSILNLEIVSYKINNFLSTDKGTGEGRLSIWTNVLEFWNNPKSLILGHGTYGLSAIFESSSEGNVGWLMNLYLQYLVDYGIIGVVIFMVFIYMLFRYTYIYKQNVKDQNLFTKNLLIGCRLAIFGILITSFFSNSTTQIFPWVIFGFTYSVHALKI